MHVGWVGLPLRWDHRIAITTRRHYCARLPSKKAPTVLRRLAAERITGGSMFPNADGIVTAMRERAQWSNMTTDATMLVTDPHGLLETGKELLPLGQLATVLGCSK